MVSLGLLLGLHTTYVLDLMDWKDLAKHVADASPLLGGLLGGPAGATVGAWIAKAFGSSSGKPEDVLKALTDDAQWAFKLKELEVTHQKDILTLQTQLDVEELKTQVSQIQAVNETMRVEAQSEHWVQYSWRPFWGFSSGLAFFIICVFFCVLAYDAIYGRNTEAMKMIPELVSAFTGLFSIAGAVLGISAWFRGKEKIEKILGDKKSS